MDFQTAEQVAALIDAAGGPTALAKRMGFDKHTGRQRVGMWKSAGKIPPMVVKAYRPLLKRIMARAQRETTA